MVRRDAAASFHGYRLQLLYTLWRCLHEADGHVVRLEGLEDLDVLDANGSLIEAVQVKAYQAPLTWSDLQEKSSGPTAIPARIAAARSSSPNARIKIVSYSGFGRELRDVRMGDAAARGRIARKLVDSGGSADLLDAIAFEECDASLLRDQVVGAIANGVGGGDPRASMDLLLYWLFEQAEARASVSRVDVVERLARVGRFVSERAAHASEWFTSIRPLIVEADELAADHLRAQFENGASVRFEHVAVGLDLHREDKLRAIGDGFESAGVVVLHGSSGQGKSCLAYRYLHDYVPPMLRYEIRRIADLAHAGRIVVALSEHARFAAVPIYVYLDVQPGDTQWSVLVEELATVPHLRILVGIREEDWRRGRSIAAARTVADLHLTFDEPEAARIFERFFDRGRAAFVDFEQAWRHFGGRGPLLEFTYLLNHHDTLHARLGQQVARLRAELEPAEVAFAAAVLCASELGCPLVLADLVASAGLSRPLATLDRLEREYLVRRSSDPSVIEGLHPVRSAVALDLLCDAALMPWSGAARLALTALRDEYLEGFLLHALVWRGRDGDVVLSAATRVPRTWAAVAGVLRALLWLAIRDHVAASSGVIADARSAVPGLWKYMLFGNVVGLPGGEGDPFIDVIAQLAPDRVERAVALRARLPPPDFARARAFSAEPRDAVQPPVTVADWHGVAEMLFWIAFWQLSDVSSIVERLEGDIAGLSLPLALSILRAIDAAPGETVAELRARIRRRFRDELEVLRIERSDEVCRSDFVVRNDLGVLIGSEAHEEAMRQVEALRSLEPTCLAYGCRGHGGIGFEEFDETLKTRIPHDAFPAPWGVHCNRIARNLAIHGERPPTWAAYVESCLRRRRAAVVALEEMRSLLCEHFASLRPFTDGSRFKAMLDLRDELTADLALPVTAVDPWGFATEGDLMDSQNRRALAVAPHAPWKYAKQVSKLNTYLAVVTRLIEDGAQGLAFGNHSTRGTKKRRQGAPLLWPKDSMPKARGAALELRDAIGELHTALHEELGALAGTVEWRDLEADERRLADSLWALWQLFCAAPAAKVADAEAHARERVERWIAAKSAALEQALRRSADRVVVRTAIVPQGSARTLSVVVDVIEASAPESHGAKVEQAIETTLRDTSAIARACYSTDLTALRIVTAYRGHSVPFGSVELKMAGLAVGMPIRPRPVLLEREQLVERGVKTMDIAWLGALENCIGAWVALVSLFERHRAIAIVIPDDDGDIVWRQVQQRLGTEWQRVVEQAADLTRTARESMSSADDGRVATVPAMLQLLDDLISVRDDLTEHPAWVQDAEDRLTHLRGIATALANSHAGLFVEMVNANA